MSKSRHNRLIFVGIGSNNIVGYSGRAPYLASCIEILSLLFRRHPPQINYPPRSVPPPPNFRCGGQASLDERVVFQDWSFCVITSHLSYTFDQGCHCEAIVKVHGVLPSSRWYSASSRRIQFHRVHVGDSGAVVTPFVQVATYATRNFATLGQLELLPPFTGASIQSL